MRTFISLIVLIVTFVHTSNCSDGIGTDGFNYYKDYIRARPDDISALASPYSSRALYFYRTPVQDVSSEDYDFQPVQDYRKRSGNTFKNHMRSKDTMVLRELEKRVSKSALAMLLTSKGSQPVKMEKIPENMVQNDGRS